MLYIVLCANLCVAQDTTHILYRYSYYCNRKAQTKKRNKHGKGVQYQPKKKNPYRAYINIDGKPVGLGYYKTAEEANAEYVKARQAQVNCLKERYKGTVDDRVWDGLMREVFCK